MRQGLAFIIAVLCLSGTAHAQNVNVRGTVSAFDGKSLSVKARDGRDVQVDLADNTPISITKPFSLEDLKPGMVLGVTTVKRGEDIVAIDVRPIPPSAPLGLSPYDLQPGSTMTNATLEGTVQSMSGRELMLNYKSGSVKVIVPSGTPMSQAAPGSRADITPGAAVYVAARPGEGGRLTGVRVQVGKNGVNPTQ